MNNCVSLESQQASLLGYEYLGIEKRLSLSLGHKPDGDLENSTIKRSENRLGLIPFPRTEDREYKLKRHNFPENFPSSDENALPTEDCEFDIVQGMKVLIRKNSDITFSNWKELFSNSASHESILQLNPVASNNSQSSSRVTWVRGTIQSFQYLRDPLRKVDLRCGSALSRKAYRTLHRKYSHLLVVRFRDGSEVKVLWPDRATVRFPSLTTFPSPQKTSNHEDCSSSDSVGDSHKMTVKEGTMSMPKISDSIQSELEREEGKVKNKGRPTVLSAGDSVVDGRSSDSDDDSIGSSNKSNDNLDEKHSDKESNSDSDSDSSSSCDSDDLKALFEEPQTTLNCSEFSSSSSLGKPSFVATDTKIGDGDDLEFLKSLSNLSAIKKIATAFSGKVRADEVLHNSNGLRVSERQVNEVEAMFESWQYNQFKPFFKIVKPSRNLNRQGN